jgi:GrpB-like predicted nucleotidyltransferase (UPF0157 family)
MNGSSLGLHSGTVALRRYDPAWPSLFAVARDAIASALDNDILAIEHIGSTSVPGLAAKPIIDIAVAVESFEAAISSVEPLARLGYEHLGEFGIPRRRYFRRGDPRTHQIHMFEITSDEWRNHLAFRDHLRAHDEVRDAYEALKRELAARYPDDRTRYTESKSEFIRDVIRTALGG